MKRFDYWCEFCKHKFEQIVTADAVVVCPKCNDSQDVRRLISAPMIHMNTISDSKLREDFGKDFY